ncbi:trypsin-like peptidase domain-containing protein [Pseudomonas sp. Pseusp122]|uniref:trypsin-like peptidase domain-containing protein n=1 Tax=unclassified Pseudomonas TaxID=196821 RepID=UPI0039A73007
MVLTEAEQNRIIKLIQQGVRHVFFSNDPDFLWGAGTCFVIKHVGSYYLMTADHVITNLKADYSDLRIFEQGSKVALPFVEGFAPVRGVVHDDDEDFVIFKIDDGLYFQRSKQRIVAWDFSLARPASILPMGTKICFAGFPSASETYEDYERSIIRPLLHMRIGELASSDLGEGFYSIVDIESPISGDGFSGAPVFWMHEDGLKLVGMIIRGSSSGHILHFIDIHFIRNMLLTYERR